jgi:predicted PolB exonuclease-like 3'-5' exonuclease
MTLCVFWTSIDGFDDVDVWIHVEIESDAEMRFICYIVVINVVLWYIYICYKCGLSARKQQKEKKKNFPALPTA